MPSQRDAHSLLQNYGGIYYFPAFKGRLIWNKTSDSMLYSLTVGRVWASGSIGRATAF